jgi:hypothetical protein
VALFDPYSLETILFSGSPYFDKEIRPHTNVGL